MAKTKLGSSDGEAGRDEAMARLQEIPNVGPRIAEDLLKLGVARLENAQEERRRSEDRKLPSSEAEPVA